MPATRTASATPATSGPSGPTTTRSASRRTARAAIPGLPGATCTSLPSPELVVPGSLPPVTSARTMACSRAPEPMTRILTGGQPSGARGPSGEQVVPDDRGVPPRADADRRDPRAGHLLERQDVPLGVDGQLLEGPAAGDVLPPAVELLEHGRRVVEVALVGRHLVEPLAPDVVGHADRDLRQAGEHVELGQDQVRQAVDPSRVARNDGVVPAAPAGAAGGHAVLATGLAQPLTGFVAQLGGERALADPGRVGLDHPDDAVDPGRRGDQGLR